MIEQDSAKRGGGTQTRAPKGFWVTDTVSWGKWQENPYGLRSLAGYSPWGGKESDATERLSTAQHCAAGRVFIA